MNYSDPIYGQLSITEPAVIDLSNSDPLQRLKGIDQAGYSKPFFPYNHISRFEHSLGVYWLLKRYGATMGEQVAGLIHDVSHSVFSHCIDYVLAEGSAKKQNHQDNIFPSFVQQSTLPAILKKHGLDLDFILNDQNFPLKEKELPDLCADRLDYSLREAVNAKEITDAEYFLSRLITQNGDWIFQDFAIAQEYAELFLTLNRKYYADIASATMFLTVGNCLRYALAKKYLKPEDLYTTDQSVLSKISHHAQKDSRLRLLFAQMNNRFPVKNSPQDPTAAVVFCKSRVTDPLCFYQKTIKRVSQIKPSWQKIIEQELKPKQYFLTFDRESPASPASI